VFDWLPQLSAFGVFLAIGGVGFLFLLVSVVFGEIFDHLDMGGGVDHDLDHGPSIFSTRVMAAFVTAFGCFGGVAVHYGMSTGAASGVGLASGFVLGGLVYLFARFLYGQQASTELRVADLVGQMARVVVAIPAGGVGQVRCRLGEELVDKIARTQDGEAIGDNAVVRIEEVLGETVVVRRQAPGGGA
jgi:membrane protein implicated in regulation of membrane protease activity